jgi:LPPG:FO 2-phospho-L-lactate transferase
VGGRALKGPAAKMMEEMGLPVTAAAVADYYGDLIDAFVYDQQDEGTLAGSDLLVIDEQDEGTLAGSDLALLCVDTIMADEAGRTRLAQDIIAFAAGLIR